MYLFQLEVSNPNQLRNSRTLISTRNAACDLVRVRSTLQLVGIQSGEYLCLASNEFGKSEAQTRFYVVREYFCHLPSFFKSLIPLGV